MNSWGAQWADNGFCWVDYDHFRKVVNEGYVAKDARNGPPPAESTPPRTQRRPSRRPSSRRAPAASLAIIAVSHNATFPNQPNVFYMRFDGIAWLIPAGLGRIDQIAVYFYYRQRERNAGPDDPQQRRPVRRRQRVRRLRHAGLPHPRRRPAQHLDRLDSLWRPGRPGGTMVVTAQGNVYQAGETRLLAQAVLFIDNFGVVRSPFIPFLVRK